MIISSAIIIFIGVFFAGILGYRQGREEGYRDGMLHAEELLAKARRLNRETRRLLEV
jgi:hypothetical protein